MKMGKFVKLEMLRLVAMLSLALPATLRAQFTFVTNADNTITITRYTGSGGDVIIPSSTNGFPVTSIGTNAFYNRSSLTSVTIPNTVTNIGYQAFYGCTSLSGVTIPSSVTSIGDEAFWFCYNLTTITVDTNNLSYSSVAGVLFNKGQTLLIAYPEGLKDSYIIPSSVTSIGDLAFYFCKLSGVTIPSSVTNIGDRAFFDCTSLTKVTIPGNVTSIGIATFFGCISLTSIMVDTNNSSYSSVGGILFSKNKTTLIAYPGGLGGPYAIPACVTTIGDEAFDYCIHLTSVTIPNSITNIGNLAFSQCQRLTSVTIPKSVLNIGSNAFFSCTMLTQAYFSGNAPSGDSTVFPGLPGTVYYVPGTTGWGSTFGGWPTALWHQPNPMILGSGYGLRVTTNGFAFTISWATNVPVVVEASTKLVDLVWTPLTTNTLVNGTYYFSDRQWTDYPSRFYRVRSP